MMRTRTMALRRAPALSMMCEPCPGPPLRRLALCLADTGACCRRLRTAVMSAATPLLLLRRVTPVVFPGAHTAILAFGLGPHRRRSCCVRRLRCLRPPLCLRLCSGTGTSPAAACATPRVTTFHRLLLLLLRCTRHRGRAQPAAAYLPAVSRRPFLTTGRPLQPPTLSLPLGRLLRLLRPLRTRRRRRCRRRACLRVHAVAQRSAGRRRGRALLGTDAARTSAAAPQSRRRRRQAQHPVLGLTRAPLGQLLRHGQRACARARPRR
jgi:hypothetical protein